MSSARPIDFYTKLLTSEYADSEKLIAILTIYIEKLNDVTTLLDTFTDVFDLDQAVGDQLDIIGEIVGQSRNLNFQPTGDFSSVLGDADYRLLLKARIGRNHWDGKSDSLYALWLNLFPGGQIIVQDNQDMSMSVYLLGSFPSSVFIDLVQHDYIVPRPEGVKINYYMGTFPLLGWDYHDAYIDGWDIGNWWTPGG